MTPVLAVVPLLALNLPWVAVNPPQGDIRRFPPGSWFQDEIIRCVRFQGQVRAYQTDAQRMGFHRTAATAQAQYDDLEYLYTMLSRGRDVADQVQEPKSWRTPDYMDQRFREFRVMLGRDLYYRGPLIRGVPDWFYTEVPRGQVPLRIPAPVVLQPDAEPCR